MKTSEEITHFFKRFVVSSTALLLVIVIGTAGFHYFSDYDAPLVDCLYMTFITITTIGYGEIINFHGNPLGRVFTMLIAISGIGVFTYMLSNFTAFVIGDELAKSYKKRRERRMIETYKNHYIICGSGEIGHQIADELLLTKRNFVLIDKLEPEFPEELEKKIIVLIGDATDESLLRAAGIDRAAGVFAVTGDDNYNLVITFTAKNLNPDLRIVAKCRDLKNIEKIKKAGANSVISPYLIGGLRIVSEMIRPTVVSFLDTMLRDREKNLRIEEIDIPSSYKGKKLSELNLENHPGVLVLALKEDAKWIFNPSKDNTLGTNNTIVAMVTPEERHNLKHLFGTV